MTDNVLKRYENCTYGDFVDPDGTGLKNQVREFD